MRRASTFVPTDADITRTRQQLTAKEVHETGGQAKKAEGAEEEEEGGQANKAEGAEQEEEGNGTKEKGKGKVTETQWKGDSVGEPAEKRRKGGQAKKAEEAEQEEEGKGTKEKGKGKVTATQWNGDYEDSSSSGKATTHKVLTAKTLMREFEKTTSSASSLLFLIDTDEAWQWARNDTNKEPLQKAKDKVDTIIKKTEFSQDIVVMDEKDLKKKYGKERYDVELEQLDLELTPALKQVRFATSTLCLTQDSRIKAAKETK